MKKKLLILAVAVILVSIVASATLAYFTASGTATNVITAGNIKIALHDKTLKNGKLEDFAKVENLMPGAEVSKVVFVENTGDNEAFVRIKVEKEIKLKGSGDVDLSLIGIAYSKDWTLQDGYYVYNHIVKPGEETKPLFETVTFSGDLMKNQYQGCQVDIKVSAQATQVANNGTDPLKAQGWPIG